MTIPTRIHSRIRTPGLWYTDSTRLYAWGPHPITAVSITWANRNRMIPTPVTRCRIHAHCPSRPRYREPSSLRRRASAYLPDEHAGAYMQPPGRGRAGDAYPATMAATLSTNGGAAS